jgi:hypothetical protein
MSCAKCEFYIPKELARAQMIEGKANLLRVKQEIPLTGEEGGPLSTTAFC